jgi:hypothetical protein
MLRAVGGGSASEKQLLYRENILSNQHVTSSQNKRIILNSQD